MAPQQQSKRTAIRHAFLSWSVSLASMPCMHKPPQGTQQAQTNIIRFFEQSNSPMSQPPIYIVSCGLFKFLDFEYG